jgi:hypothetical protein
MQDAPMRTAEHSGPYLLIQYDSWVTRMRVSGGFSLRAFMDRSLREQTDTE